MNRKHLGQIKKKPSCFSARRIVGACKCHVKYDVARSPGGEFTLRNGVSANVFDTGIVLCPGENNTPW